MSRAKAFALLITAIMVLGMTAPLVMRPAAGTQTYTVSPALPVNLLVPQANTVRQAWAALVLNNLQQIGVSASELIAGWGTIYDRALTPAASVAGSNYTSGGFDTLFLGYAITASPDPFGLFHSSQFAPSGQNYYFWNDPVNDAMINNITSTSGNTAGLVYSLKEWQAYEYDQLPSVAIVYSNEVNAFALNVNGSVFAPYQFPLWPAVERWQYTQGSDNTSITVAQTGPNEPEYGGQSLSPAHTTSYYDITALNPIFGEGGGFGLMGMNGGDQPNPYQVVPYMAQSFVQQPNYHLTGAPVTNYTFYLRHDIYFQNNESLDARDVVWGLRYEMTPDWGSPVYAFVTGILGSNSSVYWGGETGTPAVDANHPGDIFTVHFNLTKPWAFFMNDIALGSIMPSSVIVNSTNYNTLSISNFKAFATANDAMITAFHSSSYATGFANYTYSYWCKNGTTFSTGNVGPFGAGPYKYIGTNLATSITQLQKWNGYFRAAALEAAGFFNIKNYYIANIPASTGAVAALKSGDVQVLDSQYHLERSLSVLDPAWSKYVSYVAFDVQEWGFNMNSKIWGTGTETPLGLATPARAAEAAYYVRHAFELCVPKDTIIKTLMGGQGSMGITSAICTIHTYNGQSVFLGYSPQGFGPSGPSSPYSGTVNYLYRNETESNALLEAISYLERAGYVVTPVTPPSFWDAYGLLLAVVELAVIVVLAGFYFYRPRTKA